MTALALAVLAAPASATTELSGTLTREEDGSVIDNNHTIGVTRWSVALGTADGDAIPVEWTANTDAAGFYRFDLDESLPGMDQLLVFTSDNRVYGELYPAVDLRGIDPKGADIVEPGVVLLDLTAGPLTGVDFVLGRTEEIQMVAMTDGIRLDTRSYRPSRRPGMSWPVILTRTPYAIFGAGEGLMRRDYAVVIQNTRGRFDSEGDDTVFDSDGWVTHQDGYDTIKWIDAQPFSEDDKICAQGKSAPGITGYLAAGAYPEELVCVWAEVAGGNFYHDYYYPGGQFRKHMIETWMAENDSLHKLPEILAHPHHDSYWDDRTLNARLPNIDIPMLHYAGWYDIVSQGTLDIFKTLQDGVTPGARRNQKLVVGAWSHNATYTSQNQGRLQYPPWANYPEWQEDAWDWFDFWLKGVDNGVMDTPPVRAYVMGPGNPTGGTAGNFWRTSAGWPPPSAETAYYLHPGGLLSTSVPTVASAETSYVADPDNPVQTIGGSNLFDDYGVGPWDQRPADDRADVLVWETGPLLAPVEISGPIKMVLHAASDQPDTDWVVKFEDVYPDGRAMLVTDLILKARHRYGFDRENLLTPNQIYEFEVDLWDTSLTFALGHSIRVAIASSNYPRFESNPQTGEPFNQHTGTAIATNRIVHDASHPSRLLLPVVTDPAALQGCAATEHVGGLTVDKLAGGQIRLNWNAVTDACQAQYRVYAGEVGPQWPWIVRRPIVETTNTQVDVADDGIFWQVVVEGTDGGNGPHGVP